MQRTSVWGALVLLVVVTCSTDVRRTAIGRAQVSWTYSTQPEEVRLSLQVAAPGRGGSVFLLGFCHARSESYCDLTAFETCSGRRAAPKVAAFVTDARGKLRWVQGVTYAHRLRSDAQALTFSFARPWAPCTALPPNPFFQIGRGTVYLVFAEMHLPRCDAFELPALAGSALGQLRPAFAELQLLSSEPLRPPPLDGDTHVWDVLNPNVTLPAQQTTYWCSLHRLPPVRRNMHIVGYDAVITKGNEHLVHHIEVYHCEVPVGERLPAFNEPCQGMQVPDSLSVCRSVLGAWAMGAHAMMYPDEAGILLTPAMSPYVLLEVHLNFQHHKTTDPPRPDSSGLRLFVTDRLRQYNVGILETGVEYTDKMVIPPRQESFLWAGECVSECTKVAWPADGIWIFASQLHTHTTGRRVWTSHYRGGRQLADVNRDDNYDSMFQQIRLLPRRVHVRPGDSLVTVCEFSTADKANVTLGGFGITEEMCVNYLHYYPKTDLEVCKSSLSYQTMDGFFGRQLRSQLHPDEPAARKYQHVRWSPAVVDTYQTMLLQRPLTMMCNHSNGDSFAGRWENIDRTVLWPERLRLTDHLCSAVDPDY